MQNILRALDLKKELDSLRPLNKDQEEKILQKFRLDWNYHSNHLEGNSLTFGETKNLILHGITAQGKPLKDHFEITGHNEALDNIIDVIKAERPLTENFIRELHTLLLKESYEVNAETADGTPTKKRIEVGKYKTSQNHVKTSTGEIFRFAEPEETAAKMHDLLEWYRNKKEEKDVNAILLAAEFHYKFIVIHPFDDGNGRMARILMNFIFMSFNYPPVIIKTDDKIAYFFALRQADNGEIDFFIDYIAKNLVRSLEIMIAGAKGESIEEPDDIDKNIALLEHKLKGIGGKVEIFKSKKTLVYLFNSSISKLCDTFILYNEKFNKFYRKSFFRLNLIHPNGVLTELTNDWRKVAIDNISHVDTDKIEIYYYHRTFKYLSIEEFDYIISIKIRFSETKYIIESKHSKLIKLYKDELTDSEIIEIVKNDITLHHEYIEGKIKAFEENKKNK